MAKVDIQNISNLQNEPAAVQRINENFRRLQDVIETLLSRDGVAPNHMVEILDMNARRIINVGAPVNPNDAVRFQEIQDFYALVIAEADRAEAEADRAEGEADRATSQANGAAGSASTALTQANRATSEANRAASEASAADGQADRAALEANRAEAAADALELYELNFYVEKSFWPSETVYALATRRGYTFRTDQSGSYARSTNPSVSGQTLSLRKNGVQFGTIVWGASATTGTITVSSETSFAPGDLFEIFVSSVPDPGLRNITISLLTHRTV